MMRALYSPRFSLFLAIRCQESCAKLQGVGELLAFTLGAKIFYHISLETLMVWCLVALNADDFFFKIDLYKIPINAVFDKRTVTNEVECCADP